MVLAGGGPFGADVSANEFMVVVDSSADQDQLGQAFVDAGFSKPQRIMGVARRHGNWQLVKVPTADDATRGKLLAISGVQRVRPVYRVRGLDDPILSNGQVIVRFKPGTTQAQATAVAAKKGASIARQFNGLPQAYVLDIDESAQTANDCATAIAGDANVLYAHPSLLFKLQKFQAGPIEDPLYTWQWHLNNTAQLTGGRAGADIEVEEAWNVTLGGGAVVAVIDDSIQRDHEDLAANYMTGFDFLEYDDDPSPIFGPAGDCYWIEDDQRWYCYSDPIGEAHGTATSGLIAAAANGIGVRGVAPEANLIGCKIGLGPYYSFDQDIADAFLFAEQNGAMVINNSWGGPSMAYLPAVPNTWIFLPDLVSDAIDQVATSGRGGLGVLVTFSSGNGEYYTGEPIPISYGNIYATLPSVMAVGATLRDDRLACYSNYGPEQSVVAPGGGLSYPDDYPYYYVYYQERDECYEADIATTDNMQVTGYLMPGYEGWPIRGYNPMMKFLDVVGYTWCPATVFACNPLVPDPYAPVDFENVNYTRHFTGTSAACPVASGVAALVFSVSSTLTAEQVRNIIEHTADKPTYLNEVFDVVTGHSNRYGHGRVNARRAVQAAVAGKTWPSPVQNLQNVSTGSMTQLSWTNPVNDVIGVLVVRGSTGQLVWAPQDGVSYTVGQQVAPGVVVVASGLIETLDQPDLPAGEYEYAVFTRNTTSYYSWGRRASFDSQGSVTTPQASLSASPTMGMAPLTVHFAGGAIDPSGTKNLSFSWEFGDGGTAFGATADHTYLSPGNYIVRLRVTNTFGQSAEATTRIIVSSEYNLPPQATISASPTSGAVPLVVTFEAVASDQDGVITGYLWDFGDGSTGAGQRVEHTFINAGTYGVMLVVTDDLGATATDAVLITAQATSTTAARTEPSGLLTTPLCGSGVTLAVAGGIIGMLSLLGRRRR
jgi:PKD repeat protein